MASNVKPLTEFPVPKLSAHDIAAATPETIHAEPLLSFQAQHAQQKIAAAEGNRVLGADFGGDKGVTKLFVVQDGKLVIDESYSDYVQGDLGEGYLQSLEKTVAFSQANDIPMGISWGAPLEGVRALYHPKLKTFLAEFEAQYQSDFSLLSPTVRACLNDGPTGLISGAVEAHRIYGATEILLVINGGGLGLAALANNQIYATETGHLQVPSNLNTYYQTDVCGVFGATFTCLEQVGANKAGIETQWQQITGSYMRAVDIENEYKAGNKLAAELYDHSAHVVAHMIACGTHALEMDMQSPQTAIVGHGGAFKFPHYGERVQQILVKHYASPQRIILTKDYGDPNSNACLDGAAIAALVQ